MKIVLDTNVVLRALSSKSVLRYIVDALFDGRYELIVSTEILFEYAEKITQFYGASAAESFLTFLRLLPNVTAIEPYFRLNLIVADPDDNKFVDCAFAGNAHYIVTNDRHFNVLKTNEFPKFSIIKAEDFLGWLQT